MAEFKKISYKASVIIDNFFEKCYHKESPANHRRSFPTYEEFVVSLYAMTPNADSRVLQELDEYRIDLAETLSSDEIDVLLKEFGAVIRYCSESDFLWWPSKSLSCLLPKETIDLCHSIVSDYIRSFVRIGFDIFQDEEVPIAKTEICGDVLFPFADDVQFAENLDRCSFDVYEHNPKFLTFGQILNNAYLRDEKIHLGCSSQIVDGKLYDYVFSCPVLRKDVCFVANELYNVATHLKDNGVMCCILPESFCYAPEWFGFRKILIDKRGQYSALVITMPDLMQPYVTENICMFCLLKPEKEDVLNYYGGISDSVGVIKYGDYITDDAERVENWLNERIDRIVLINAKRNDFLIETWCSTEFMKTVENDGYTLNLLKKFSFSGQLMLDTILAKGEYFVQSWESSSLGDDINLLPSVPIYDFNTDSSESHSNDGIFVGLDHLIDLVPLSAHKPFDKEEEICRIGTVDLFTNYLNCDISCNKECKTKRVSKCYSKISEVVGNTANKLLSSLIEKSYSFSPDRVNEKCLLACYSNGRLKVGRIVDSSCLYELGPEIIAFKIKSDEVSEDFLLRSLMSDLVAKQATTLSWGGFYNSIDPEDFLQIMISVPDKEEQERLCREDVRKSLETADQKLKDAFKDFREDIHMKRHAIGQTIFDFNNWWNELQDARNENKVLTDETIVGNLRMRDIYDRLQDALSRLQQQIYKLDRGNGLTAEDFALTTFIEEFMENHQSPVFEFEYNVEKHHVSEDVPDYKEVEIDKETGQLKMCRDGWVCRKGDPCLDEYVNFPCEALTMVLENIVSNACSHGFTDDSSKENKIRIDFEWVGGYVVATVANNGKPLNRELQPNEVFLYGKSSKNGKGHYGLGGYEIKRLMQEFGGDAEIESTPTEEFTFSYKLTFPEALSCWHSYEMNISPPSPDALRNEPNNSEQAEN